ncbi:peroxisomal membrane protein 11A isoform X2 [Xenopus laevis]|nr:peroxisomal membrane protein 11A isoform X2 [Xenopus laevis]XP_018108702.1 peroxisomal membrane protein 11A isoform X2 [Xenopus laevis]XP_041442778.1 peroxisomal membrane protein 11A isoform X2 [Xenopus laevis]
MDSFIQITNQSQGRDRFFRATQYACMLLRYLVENKPGAQKVAMKLKQVESNMSSGRKLFRLGNFVHALKASKASMQILDPIPRCCLTAANLNRVFYFVCDTVLWARSVGVVSGISKETWLYRATKCYYYSLLLNILTNIYEISWRMEKEAKERKQQASDTITAESDQDLKILSVLPKGFENFLFLLFLSFRNHPPLLLDTVKNVCDLLSPLDRLEIYSTNQGVIGICGLVSSIVGILTVANPSLKIKHLT